MIIHRTHKARGLSRRHTRHGVQSRAQHETAQPNRADWLRQRDAPRGSAPIAGLGGAAAWPVAAWAQQGDRVRRIGLLIGGDENTPPPVKASVHAGAFSFAPAP